MPEIVPLPGESLPILRPLLGARPPLEASFALEAAIAGNLTCQAWVDDPLSPSLGYLWNGGALHYILGGRTLAAEEVIAAHFSEAIAPVARQRGAYYLKLRAIDEGWAGWWPPASEARPGARVAYLVDSRRVPGAPAPLPAGYSLVEIDAALLDDATLDTSAARAEIASCWPSVARYRERGWGYGVLCGRELVAWCTAELVSPGRCGVGIETIEAHQRRGLGTAVATAMAQRCAREGISALWDAWEDNGPSRRTGVKSGWALAEHYTVAFSQLSA